MSTDNGQIAARFAEMAELLRIRGGDAHRTKAFARAGQVIAALPEPVAQVLGRGGLARVPGLGEGTVHRVKQMLRTGTCDDLERLRASVPQGLRRLLALKGLGPRTVRRLHQQLGIQSLEQLAWAADHGVLTAKAHMSAERVHALRAEIALLARQGGKVPLVEAERSVAPILEALRTVRGVEQAASGGSVRRRQAMIGDLDVLVSAADAAPVIETFLGLGSAVIGRRTDGGSIRLESLQQADLWVFPPESWGAGLHAFTGNKEHLVNLRTRAGRLGLHISEHGISDRTTGRRIAWVADEAEIYRALGLPFIEVELRANLGEIEAAEAGRLPDLVVAGDLRGDLHMHTTWSDGAASAKDMASAARQRGLDYIAITDHSAGLAIAGGLDARRLEAQGTELEALRRGRERPAVLAGIEVDILEDGSLDLDAGALRKLDWVVASVHRRHGQDGRTITDRVIRAMETGLVDCIGHPTGRKLGRRPAIELEMDRLLAAARRLGVALEINANPLRMDLPDVLCRQAKAAGVALVLSTDAHAPGELERTSFGLAMARRGWIEARDVLNTRPLDEVLAFRRGRLRRHGIAVPAALQQAQVASVAEAAADVAEDDLVAALEAPDDALRARLERFLETGDDPALEAALRSRSDNPVQRAFALIVGS